MSVSAKFPFWKAEEGEKPRLRGAPEPQKRLISISYIHFSVKRPEKSVPPQKIKRKVEEGVSQQAERRKLKGTKIKRLLSFPDYGYGSSEDSKKAASLCYSPDLNNGHRRRNPLTTSASNPAANLPGGGTITPTTVCYEYSYPDSNSNHSKSGFARPVSEHHYEQPMVVFPPSQSPSDSIGKPSRSESSTTASSSSNQQDRGKGKERKNL